MQAVQLPSFRGQDRLTRVLPSLCLLATTARELSGSLVSPLWPGSVISSGRAEKQGRLWGNLEAVGGDPRGCQLTGALPNEVVVSRGGGQGLLSSLPFSTASLTIYLFVYLFNRY